MTAAGKLNPNYRHGLTHTSTFKIWADIIKRCSNRNYKDFKYYGGKGITVCKRWLRGVEYFLEDMGPRPSKKHSIDRIDNNKGYSKANCRWATIKEQARNRTNNRIINYAGQRRTLAEWAEVLNIAYSTLNSRLNRGGYSVEQAFTWKLRQRKWTTE